MMDASKLPCKEAQDPCPLVRKLVLLMDGPMTSEFLDRHVTLLDEFVRACSYAFWVRDLPFVIRLIEILSNRIQDVPVLRPYLKYFLEISRIPPMLSRSSEVLEHKRDLEEYFSSFGYLLVCLKDTDLQDLVFKAVKNVFTRNKPVGICCVSVPVCKEAIAESQLPEIVVRLLEVGDDTFYKKLLKLTRLLMGSQKICRIMIKEKILNVLILRLAPSWPKQQEPEHFHEFTYKKSETMDLSLNIILELLEFCRRSDEKFKNEIEAPSYTAWKCLNFVLRILSIEKNAKVHRNAILCITILCLDVFNNIPVIGILPDDVAILCAASVSQAQDTWASEVKFTADSYDFKFLDMILLMLSYYPKYPDSLKYFRKRESLARILLLINTNVQLIWNDYQRFRLILVSLRVLKITAPMCVEQFLQYDGVRRLLHLTKVFMVEGFDEEVLHACLKCIFSTINTGNKAVIERYREKFGIDVLLCLADTLLQRDMLTMKVQSYAMYSFCILYILNEEYNYSNEKVITTCLPYMKRVLNPHGTDMPHHPKLLIALLDYLWENICWSQSNLKYFVSQSGVYVLLDIIEKSCCPVKLIGLSLLIDLCEEGSCIPYLLTWRGEKTTVIPLLLEMFRNENTRLEVKDTDRGIIEDIEQPLMGKLQEEVTFLREKDPNTSPAVVDLLATCRPKIYAILHLLQCRFKEQVDLINEKYKISTGNYTIDDQITKLVAENFLPLKIGEVWVELNKDLKTAGIIPIESNQHLISTIIQRFYKWSAHIKKIQEELLKREEKQDAINEKMLYNMLREARLATSLEALRELKYIARCTEAIFRLVSKINQRGLIWSSLSWTENFLVRFHRTFDPNMTVTPVFNQKVSVTSNIIVDPNEELFDIKPVSPNESQLSLRRVKGLRCVIKF